MRFMKRARAHSHSMLDAELPVSEPRSSREAIEQKRHRDDVCGDEVAKEAERDGAELQGSMLEVGAAAAGLMPIEMPRADGEDREPGSGGSGCGTC